MLIELKPTESLQPHDKNPRKNDRAVDAAIKPGTSRAGFPKRTVPRTSTLLF